MSDIDYHPTDAWPDDAAIRVEAMVQQQLREDRNLSILLNTLAHANGVMSNGILQLYSGQKIDIRDLVRKTGRVA